MEKPIKPGLVAAYATIPFVLALPPLIGWWIGKWLDSVFVTDPILMYIGILLGVVAGIREFLRIIRKFKE